MQERMSKTRKLEVLREAGEGGRSPDWFEGKVPENEGEYIHAATKQLLRLGLLEKAQHPRIHYRLPDRGRAFFHNVLAKIGGHFGIDWKRIHEIEFPLVNNR